MRESEREHGEGRVDSTVKEGRFQGGLGGQAKRASLGDDAKNLQNLGFTPCLAKPEMRKEVGRQRTLSQNDRAK